MEPGRSISFKGLPVRQPPAINRFLSSTPVSLVIYCLIVYGILYSSFKGAQAMGYNWQWYQIPKYIYSYTDNGFQFGELMLGLWTTITLSFTAFLLALAIGFLVAFLRLSGLFIGTKIAICFLEFVRNVPLLVLVYLFYYVLGPVFKYDRYTASILCLAVYHSALISEILRAAINAVAQGQWEAAKSIGMGYWKMHIFVILPQALKLVIPGIANTFLALVKDTPLIFVVGLLEIVGMLNLAKTNPKWLGFAMEGYVFAAIIFWIICYAMSRYSQNLELKYKTER